MSIRRLKQDVRDLFITHSDEVLSNVIERNPSKNAFSVRLKDVDGDRYHFVIGFDEDSEASEQSLYIYRRYGGDGSSTGQNAKEYLKVGENWSSVQELLFESRDFSTVLLEASRQGFLTREEWKNYRRSVTELKERLHSERSQTAIEEVQNCVQNANYEALNTLLGFTEKNRRYLWQLLYSKDEDDEIIKNEEIETEIFSNGRHRVLYAVGTRQYYENGDVNTYPIRIVIGDEESKNGFFLHRLKNTRGDNSVQSIGDIRASLGCELNAGDTSQFKTGIEYQFSNQFRFKRVPITDFKQDLYNAVFQNVLRNDTTDKIKEDVIPEDARGAFQGFPRTIYIDDDLSTDGLKELQDTLCIPERQIRQKQKEYGYERVSAKRRKNIIQEIVLENLAIGMEEEGNFDDLREAVERKIEKMLHRGQTKLFLQDTRIQFNKPITDVWEHKVYRIGNMSFTDSGSITQLGCNQFPVTTFIAPDERIAQFDIDRYSEPKEIKFNSGVYRFTTLDVFTEEAWMR